VTVRRLVAIAFIFAGCSVAWFVLGSSVETRTGQYDSQLSQDVALLWGGPHAQRAPEAAIPRVRQASETIVETKDGQAILGIPSSDLPSGITIRQAYGRETTITRDNIKRMSSDGKSLMPEALEEGLTPQDFADLLSFVESAK